jgi:hypothetical protein
MKDFLLNRYIALRNFQLTAMFAGLLMLFTLPLLASAQVRSATTYADAAPFEAAEGAGASANWAGYVAEGDVYTGVHASWVVPRVSPSDTSDVSADTTWVGVGGVDSRDLIQAGTQAIVEDGRVVYEAWYEILPDYQTKIPLKVRAGDSVSVSLKEVSPDVWELTFLNNTSGHTYQKNIEYKSSHSSAEWIEEMPVGVVGHSLGYLPLDNFERVQFTDAKAVVNGEEKTLREANALPLAMRMHHGAMLAAPSTVGSEGSSFSVARPNEPLVADVSPRRSIYYILWHI